jgi:hypothetical protein
MSSQGQVKGTVARLVTMLLLTAAALVGLAVTAEPALAKADIYFAAGPHNAHVGRPIHLSGSASDDNASFNRFCIQQRYGHGTWHTIRCAAGGYSGGGGLNVWLRPERRGLTLFRGVLLEGRSRSDRHARIHLISRAFALAVV